MNNNTQVVNLQITSDYSRVNTPAYFPATDLRLVLKLRRTWLDVNLTRTWRSVTCLTFSYLVLLLSVISTEMVTFGGSRKSMWLCGGGGGGGGNNMWEYAINDTKISLYIYIYIYRYWNIADVYNLLCRNCICTTC